jgi:hypothetical protein
MRVLGVLGVLRMLWMLRIVWVVGVFRMRLAHIPQEAEGVYFVETFHRDPLTAVGWRCATRGYQRQRRWPRQRGPLGMPP